ncbi:YveK family protein [Adlercreutzia sp. ZJ138]|uniref:YveK family protein n=1 Tax=Adlercreutzia sp. ZJ138 TaxID=2709405 RepID=UPI0013EB5AA8|nr:Wzz/FepE/Etk N-terminal domain-containing protein [Adlercreutzia sp. ZJ138]
MTLLELLQLMRKHLKLMIALPLACGVAMALVAFLFLPNTYTSSVSMYVLTKSTEETGGLNNQDLTASQMLTNDVATLIEGDRVMNDTAEALQMESLNDYTIEVTSATTTRVITLSVTGEDAQSTAIIANKLAEQASVVAQEVMDVQSVNAIDQAETPESPSGPNRLMYTAVALLAGLFLAIALVVLADMLNTRARNAEDVEELLGLPVIGRIPAMKEGK